MKALFPDEVAMAIRREYQQGNATLLELACEHESSLSVMSRMVRGLTYGWLPVLGPPATPHKTGRKPTRDKAQRIYDTVPELCIHPQVPYECRPPYRPFNPLPQPSRYTGLRARLAEANLRRRTA